MPSPRRQSPGFLGRTYPSARAQATSPTSCFCSPHIVGDRPLRCDLRCEHPLSGCYLRPGNSVFAPGNRLFAPGNSLFAPGNSARVTWFVPCRYAATSVPLAASSSSRVGIHAGLGLSRCRLGPNLQGCHCAHFHVGRPKHQQQELLARGHRCRGATQEAPHCR